MAKNVRHFTIMAKTAKKMYAIFPMMAKMARKSMTKMARMAKMARKSMAKMAKNRWRLQKLSTAGPQSELDHKVSCVVVRPPSLHRLGNRLEV